MKITLAALLHDIGKFYQRTGIKRTRKELYERYLKDNSYVHACYTARFIDENININFDDIKDLIDLSAGHHNFSEGIVKIADIIASGHDRKDAKQVQYLSENFEQNTDYKRVRLNSIFNEVKLDNRQNNEPKFLKITPLDNLEFDDSDILNENEGAKAYLKLYNNFVGEVKKIYNYEITSYKKLHDLLYPLIKNYTISIPANTRSNFPTVSLYEHLKLTSAIASCLEKEIKEVPFVILDYDVSGIQSFIYKITEGGKSKDKISKNLRSRSLYLSLLADFIAYYIINQFSLSYENVLYSSSGRGRLLLPNTPDFTEKINKICADIEKNLFNLHNGSLGIVFSYNTVDGKELSDSNLSDYTGIKNKKFINSKNQKFKSLFKDPDFSFVNEPLKKLCKMCNLEEANDELCPFCEKMIKLNDDVIAKTNEFIVEFCYNKDKSYSDYSLEIGGLGIIKIHNNIDLVNLNENSYYLSINNHKLGETKTYAMSLKKDISFPDISSIRKNNKGDDKLAVIKMDVDNLGYIFLKGLKGESEGMEDKDKHTISKSLNLSRSLDLFFTNVLPKICDRESTYINYAGGDDLVIIVPAWKSLSTIEKINNEFSKWTGNNQSFKISAGIDIFEVNSPVRYAIMRAEESLEKSKENEGKNSFTVLDETLNNSYLGLINKEIEEYEKAINSGDLSRGGIYNIYSSLVMSLEEYNNIERKYMRFVPHIAYSIQRNIENSEWKERLKNTFIYKNLTIDEIKKYKIILGYSLMNTREDKNDA